MTKLEALAKDCIENHTHRLVDKPTKQDIYLREESIFIQGYRQSEKRIATLEKENAELKEKISYLKDNLRVARKDRENLQLDVARGLKEFVKDFPATTLRYLANEKYVEQLTNAKEIIKGLLELGSIGDGDYTYVAEAEQFLKEADE